MSNIHFQAKLYKIGSRLLLKLPKDESSKLPSRGLVMVKGALNKTSINVPLEPDGKGSHWLEVDKSLQKAAGANEGDTVTLDVEPSKDWPEPKIPEDLKTALTSNPQAQITWMDITPMARWDWIRWINSTKNPETRKIRIQKTFSKFKSGIRRPCCFNRTECTVPDVSNKGVLLEPTQTSA